MAMAGWRVVVAALMKVGGGTARARGMGVAGTEAAAGTSEEASSSGADCTRADGKDCTDGMASEGWRHGAEVAG